MRKFLFISQYIDLHAIQQSPLVLSIGPMAYLLNIVDWLLRSSVVYALVLWHHRDIFRFSKICCNWVLEHESIVVDTARCNQLRLGHGLQRVVILSGMRSKFFIVWKVVNTYPSNLGRVESLHCHHVFLCFCRATFWKLLHDFSQLWVRQAAIRILPPSS